MKQQVLAGLGALAMVVGAVFARDAIDGDDGAGGDDMPVMTCPTELADACRELADRFTVRVEDAAVTAEALIAEGRGSGASEVGDVWLVPAPWAEAVRAERGEDGDEGLVGTPSPPVARSPVALVMWEDRAEALEAGPCAGTVGWACLGDAADRPWSDVGGEAAWGQVKVGLPDPGTAGGLVVLGGAAAGYFDSVDYASNDFDGTLSAWLGALGAESGTGGGGDPVGRMVTRGPGEFSAVGALEADAVEAAGRPNLRVWFPEPVATADLVAVPVGPDGEDCVDDVAGHGGLAEALAAGGWRVAGRDVADGVASGGLPPDDGLPEGDVLRALDAVWDDATG